MLNAVRAIRAPGRHWRLLCVLALGVVHTLVFDITRQGIATLFGSLVVGFAHFLSEPATGPLTPKQTEYLSYITSSTNALLAIINKGVAGIKADGTYNQIYAQYFGSAPAAAPAPAAASK